MGWKPLKVLFVGDQPSSRNVSKDVPFVGTPSYKRLLRWIGELDLDIGQVKLINRDEAACNPVYLSEFDFMIFLGKNSEVRIPIYAYSPKMRTIDHPSPRNRNFNDPEYEKKMLKQLKGWLYE